MKVKLTLKSGKEHIINTNFVTIEGFMEELVQATSGTFNHREKSLTKYGEYVDFLVSLFVTLKLM